MAFTTMTSSGTQMVTSPRGMSKVNGKIRRSFSGNDLCNQARVRRSCSDNHLCYSVNQIHASKTEPKLKNSRSFGAFKFHLPETFVPKSLRTFLYEPEISKETTAGDDTVECNEMDEDSDEMVVQEKKTRMDKRVNWVERIMEIRTGWIQKQHKDEGDNGSFDGQGCDEDFGGCEVDYDEDEGEGKKEINRETFSELLKEVSWSDTKLFSQLAFLCNMAYAISEMKAVDLRRYYDLEFVTSSLVKKAEAAAFTTTTGELDDDSTCPVDSSSTTESESGKSENSNKKRLNNRPAAAYEIAASAASFVHSRAKDLLFHGSETQQEDIDMTLESNERKYLHKDERSTPRVYRSDAGSEVAAYVTASTMTAVVAAGDKEKEEAATALQTLQSSPCEWFVCDDSSIYTRCFVIQGSDSLASWQANLFFEPTKFEGTDVLVHRGIYEAAKGIYEQFKPIILEHLEKYGERAQFRFTGHSLGGSLSLLVNLMLLTRKVVKPTALRPVVTFGSPFVFCGGQKILDKLGLDEDHIHCVIMHRDIVPRAFSCNYPDHVAQLLKRLHGTFRSHPCLNRNKLLYTPMGKVFILQPDETSSPPHPLLPPGIALHALEDPQSGSSKNGLMTFLNSPHPLEMLRNPTAYGSDGTILRDHDSSNYLKAVNGVIRKHTAVHRTNTRQGNILWPILTSQSPHAWGHFRSTTNDRILLSKEEVATAGV
ncbi:phospholipase A1 PLIP1, chloroplastic [Apium graveolens]|uniref:phospholipase A1 PLIP1, chloroplastic n=1 Tax=Apium graveolens TaxID=4045 RepID=UPI003D79A0C3